MKTQKNYIAKRPIKGTITAIMVENIGEFNEWQWYEILFDTDLKGAIQIYYQTAQDYTAEELAEVLPTIQGNPESELYTEDVKAYYINF